MNKTTDLVDDEKVADLVGTYQNDALAILALELSVPEPARGESKRLIVEVTTEGVHVASPLRAPERPILLPSKETILLASVLLSSIETTNLDETRRNNAGRLKALCVSIADRIACRMSTAAASLTSHETSSLSDTLNRSLLHDVVRTFELSPEKEESAIRDAHEKLAELQDRGLVVDPYSADWGLFGSAIVVLVGALPVAFSHRTELGDEVLRKITRLSSAVGTIGIVREVSTSHTSTSVTLTASERAKVVLACIARILDAVLGPNGPQGPDVPRTGREPLADDAPEGGSEDSDDDSDAEPEIVA